MTSGTIRYASIAFVPWGQAYPKKGEVWLLTPPGEAQPIRCIVDDVNPTDGPDSHIGELHISFRATDQETP